MSTSGVRALALAVGLAGSAIAARAQDVPAATTEAEPPPAESAASPEEPGDADGAASETDELDGSIVPPAEGPARASHSSRLAPPRTPASGTTSAPVDDEVPVAYEPPSAVLGATAEVYLAMSPAIGFGLSGLGGLGGLAGLDGPSLTGRADFVFAADPRAFFGLGLGITHAEAGSDGFATTITRVEVPLVGQVYFEDPRRGAAVPTLRIIPAFRWEEQSGTSSPRTSVGGRLDVGVGVTWFVMRWLALRFLGDVGASLLFSYEGLVGQSISVFVAADVGLVVRL